VIVVEDVRLALEVELGQRQRPAFDTGRDLADQRLEIAFVGDPDLAEVAVVFLTLGPVEDGGQGLPGQAPPLRAEVRHDAGGHLAADAGKALQLDIGVEQPAVLAPGKRKAQREAFEVQPAHRPAHVGGGHAFDEVGARAFIQIGAQLLDRAQRQAGTGGQVDMPHLREIAQHQAGGGLGGGDDAPGAPFAGMAGREADVRQIGQIGAQLFGLRAGRALVDVDHHRAIARAPNSARPARRGPARYASA
jgi:hypothetical protein